MPGTTHCIFCGDSPTTKEHLFPRWCHTFVTKVPGRFAKIAGIEHATHSDVKAGKGKGDIHDWWVKCVCGPRCNNGWMREKLENRAQPIITPLIQGRPTTLSAQDQRIVAGWATLKAIVGEYEDPTTASWSEEDLARMMRIQLPPRRDCFIWIGNYVRGGEWSGCWTVHPFSAFHRAADKDKFGEPTTEYNSAATTQIIGKLLIHVVHGPILRLFRHRGFLPAATEKMAMIWPVSGQLVRWPLKPLGDRDAREIASGMFVDIKTASKRALERRDRSAR